MGTDLQHLLPICLCLMSALCSAEELRWGYSPSNGMPYVESIDHELARGFVRDLGERVGQLLDLEVRFVETPDKRVETSLREGSIHLLCINNPQWMSEPDRLHWSPSLFDEEDALAQRSDARAFVALDDLRGRTLGTSLGYVYPQPLMDAFASRTILRNDVRDLETRLHMLERGRLDAIIDMRRPLEFLLAEHANLAITVDPVALQRFSVHCSYGPALPIPAERLDAVLRTLVDDGSVQRMLARQNQLMRQRR